MAKQNVKSLIIDLRTNGGGALTEGGITVRSVHSVGPVVQVRDNNGKCVKTRTPTA
jgi:carboxyl-terminal processing protease